jgi:hypothetical protein
MALHQKDSKQEKAQSALVHKRDHLVARQDLIESRVSTKRHNRLPRLYDDSGRGARARRRDDIVRLPLMSDQIVYHRWIWILECMLVSTQQPYENRGWWWRADNGKCFAVRSAHNTVRTSRLSTSFVLLVTTLIGIRASVNPAIRPANGPKTRRTR